MGQSSYFHPSGTVREIAPKGPPWVTVVPVAAAGDSAWFSPSFPSFSVSCDDLSGASPLFRAADASGAFSPPSSGAASTPAPFPTAAPSSFPQPPSAAITARHPTRANPLFFMLLSSPFPAHLLYCRPSGFTAMPPGKHLADNLQSGCTVDLTCAQYICLSE